MRNVCICMLLSALLVAGCASSKGESYAVAGYDFAGLNKVAIASVTGQVYGDAAKNTVSDFFVMELMKKGYTVVERAEVQKILKEQEFQASAITSNEDAARAGRVLNVPAVLLISIPKYKEKMEMTAKLVEVETATILWIGSGSGSTGKTLSTIVGAAAGAALGAAVAGGDSNDRVLGGVIGGVAGGVAGNVLSPEQRDQLKKVVADTCKDLPARFPQPTKKK